jgi:ubiquinone biosynthesis monooxygenase Coq7
MLNRQLSGLDQLVTQLDQGLRTLVGNAPTPQRASPAIDLDDAELSAQERKRALGLMRVNHAGEVCAQALYQGQALTAKLPEVGAQMERAAAEELDHLAWCESELQSLVVVLAFSILFGTRCRSALARRLDWLATS